MEYTKYVARLACLIACIGFFCSGYWAVGALSHRRTYSSPILSVSVESALHDMDNLSKTLELVDECRARMCALFDANLKLQRENMELIGQLRCASQCRGAYLSAYWASIRGSIERKIAPIGGCNHSGETEETLDMFRQTAARLHYLVHAARLLAAQNDELGRKLRSMQEQSSLRVVIAENTLKDESGDGTGDNNGWGWYLSRFVVLALSGLGLHLVWASI